MIYSKYPCLLIMSKIFPQFVKKGPVKIPLLVSVS